MKAKYRKSRLNYTLLEILSAMAVFMIICLIVVRFFSGAQKLTTSSNSYNEMYADVRAFFDIFGNDLQTIVYNNFVGPKGNQPFVLSYYAISSSSETPFSSFYGNIQEFYAQTLIPPRLGNEMALNKVSYVPLLCFIANPSNIPPTATGPTCEVRYTFVPVGATSAKTAAFPYSEVGSATPSRSSIPFKHGGKILRSLTYDDSNKPATPNYGLNRYPLDYDIFPIVNDSGLIPREDGIPAPPTDPPSESRIKWVFGDNSSCKYEEVIGHVYRMNITCYKLEPDSSGIYSYKKYRFFDMSSNEKLAFGDDSPSNYIIWPPAGTALSPKITYPSPPAAPNTLVELAQLGHPLPDMVRVDLYMLSPQDWNLLMNYYDWNASSPKFADEIAAKRLLEQKMRHFSRVFHINIKE